MFRFKAVARGNSKQINIFGDNRGEIDATTINLLYGYVQPKNIAIMALVAAIIAGGIIWGITRPSDSVDSLAVAYGSASTDGWGPDRITYSNGERPEYSKAPQTLNSVTDNPMHGDERNFFQIREAGGNHHWGDSVELQPGREYELSIFYANNTADKAIDFVRTRVQHPRTIKHKDAKVHKATAFVTAAQTVPAEVWDTVDLVNNTNGDITLLYKEGSARVTGNRDRTRPVEPSELFGAGTLVGVAEQPGTIPPGGDGFGTVVFTLKSVAPGFTFESAVQPGTTGNDFRTIIEAPHGSQVRVRLTYFNHGTTVQRKVTLKALFTESVQFVPHSAVLINANHRSGVQLKDGIANGGVQIGDYSPKTNAALYFTAFVYGPPCSQISLKSTIATPNGDSYDTVLVRISGQNC
ncbi:hypothetical protein [Nocardia cyriacigeorgica]|uniref:Uncharacterized protein n=1 Tax=Nocardia cyriacigeorgica TaxID=135487 RepID=A0A5R8NXF0_9NOCA|nr:hypothetical protein [Nocardia cyriacigeorgica]TLF80958.1 hypothetical protein FEK34_04595 [Nocardia cyriacigeorgica]